MYMYLKELNVLESKKQWLSKTLSWMGEPSFYHATVVVAAVYISFQIEIYNLDRTKSSFLASSFYIKK